MTRHYVGNTTNVEWEINLCMGKLPRSAARNSAGDVREVGHKMKPVRTATSDTTRPEASGLKASGLKKARSRAPRRMIATGAVAAVASVATITAAFALGPRVPDPIPERIPASNVTVGLEKIDTGFVSPVTGAVAPGDKKTLYVAEQTGPIWAIDVHHGRNARRKFADLSSVVLPLGCFGIQYDERGLFGLAFHPNYEKNGLLYTFTSETPVGAPTLPPNQCNARSIPGTPPTPLPDHDNVVREWRVNNPKSDGAVVDPSSSRVVLRMAHPQFNHNGGELRFGPDNMLYISTGDGGSADDQGFGHNPDVGNAQDLSSLLGKILRVDPNAGSMVPGYSIPSDNPFVSQPAARGEIWAVGFRNPYKMSFDSKTGDLYVGDVGQNDVEEVNRIVKGGNYGWRVKEGSFAFDPNGPANGFVTADVITGPYIDPIAQYDHCVPPVSAAGACANREGISVIGGFVYRGKEINALRGSYVFGDYSRGFFTSDGRLFHLDSSGAMRELNLASGGALGKSVLGIAEDGRGELYVFTKEGAAPGNTGIVDPTNTSGTIWKLTEVNHDDDDDDDDEDDDDDD